MIHRSSGFQRLSPPRSSIEIGLLYKYRLGICKEKYSGVLALFLPPQHAIRERAPRFAKWISKFQDFSKVTTFDITPSAW